MNSNTSCAETCRLGIIQFKPRSGEIEYNIEEAEKYIEQAACLGADLVLLPELWALGYGIDSPQGYSEYFGGRITRFMSGQAKKHSVYIAGGYPERDEKGICYDSAVLINPGGEAVLNHRKVHLYSLLGEDKVWAPGEGFRVVQTELGRIGILICFDGDFPEAWRSLAVQGVDLVLHPTAYESPCDEYGWWKKLYEANAIVNAVWCASANLVGATPDGGSHFFGWSRVIDPCGEEAVSVTHCRPGDDCGTEVLMAEISLADGLRKGRARNGCFLSERRPETYRLN